ncbi:hypothetical protein RclHR1_01140019 [Rhizophagus clarus]|uniref:Cytochrome P450 n=1 Tax=Rhizophagus clarus TaxID=94130 RepID=A0A2Z6Q4D2_9GLOM|nr:hypothetical protein RclHR1_01140019 [Rhizophagus clarus]GES97893.1 cytochrome P450 [Rhizophagus clarus]
MLDKIDRVFKDDKTRPITEIVNTFPRCLEKPEEIAGYKWPANTHVRISIDAIHHNNEYWEDPENFNPDRWMVEGFEPKKNSFITFGGGLRVCPGRKLAMVELVSLMALLFRKYEIDLANKEAPLKTVSALITACTELSIEIRKRN